MAVKSFFQRAAIPDPQRSVDGLYPTVVALKEAIDVLIGQRGDPSETVVLRRDLQLLAVMTNATYPFTVPPRDNYVPGLSFGGLGTGIVYATNFPYGRWLRLGSLVFFTAGIVLTAKGTAVGAAGVSLPYTARPTPNGHWLATCALYNTTSPTAASTATIDPGSAYAMLWAGGGATPATPLTDAHFSNTSMLQVTGFYEAYVETTPPEVVPSERLMRDRDSH